MIPSVGLVISSSFMLLAVAELWHISNAVMYDISLFMLF
jgi:hypothetical protein